MKILDISFWPKSKIFHHFSDFQYFTLSSKNSHKLGLTPPTNMVHHSIESWEPREEDGTWAWGLRRLQGSKKWRESEAIMFYARQCKYNLELLVFAWYFEISIEPINVLIYQYNTKPPPPPNNWSLNFIEKYQANYAQLQAYQQQQESFYSVKYAF